MTWPIRFAPFRRRRHPVLQFLEEFIAEREEHDPGVLVPRSPGSALSSALPEATYWRRFDEFGVTHVTLDGDLVLNINDLFTPYGFWNGNIIQHWAVCHSFDIDDLDGRDVLWQILEASLFPAMRELLPDGDELLAAVEGTKYGDPVPDLPDFRIIVNGREAVVRTIAHFDGPFTSDADAVSALERRCGAISAPAPGAAMLEF